MLAAAMILCLNGHCYWDVEFRGPGGWCAWAHDFGGVQLAEVEGHESRGDAEAALRVAIAMEFSRREKGQQEVESRDGEAAAA
jgi:hypothetical protein